MTDKDRLYYQHRAERELQLAAEAEDAVVCKAHYDLATQYLERAHGTALAVPADPERLRARR